RTNQFVHSGGRVAHLSVADVQTQAGHCAWGEHMSDEVGAVAAALEAELRLRLAGRDALPEVLVGLLGRGIQHSRSPMMHEREAARLGITGSYVLIDFDALGFADSDLGSVLRAVKHLGFKGVNVTYPFKQAIMPLLDKI